MRRSRHSTLILAVFALFLGVLSLLLLQKRRADVASYGLEVSTEAAAIPAGARHADHIAASRADELRSVRVRLDPENNPESAIDSGAGVLLVRLIRKESRHPLHGLPVRVVHRSEWHRVGAGVSAKTDVSGVARFWNVRAGPVFVATLCASTQRLEVVPHKVTSTVIEVKESYRVSVRVISTLHVPIPNARVWTSYYESVRSGAYVGRTDAAGLLTVDGLPSEAWLGAEAEGYGRSLLSKARLGIDHAAPIEIIIEEDRGIRVSGFVRALAGRPIFGAEVLIGDEGCDRVSDAGGSSVQQRFPPPLRVRTRHDGFFAGAALAHGHTVAITVRARGYGTQSLAVAVRAATAEVSIVLAPEGTALGRVLGHDGRGLRGLSLSTGNRWLAASAHGMTDRKGTFVLRGLSEGRHQISIIYHGKRVANRWIDIRSGETIRLDDIVIGRAGVLRGRFRGIGTGFGMSARVFCAERGWYASVPVARDGGFELSGLDPGRNLICAVSSASKHAILGKWLDVQQADLELGPSDGSSVTGSVVNGFASEVWATACDVPVLSFGARLSAGSNAGSQMFSFCGLPDGKYNLHVATKSSADLVITSFRVAQCARLHMGALELGVVRKGELQILVDWDTGSSARDCRVAVVPVGGGQSRNLRLAADERQATIDLPAGDYWVTLDGRNVVAHTTRTTVISGGRVSARLIASIGEQWGIVGLVKWERNKGVVGLAVIRDAARRIVYRKKAKVEHDRVLLTVILSRGKHELIVTRADTGSRRAEFIVEEQQLSTGSIIKVELK